MKIQAWGHQNRCLEGSRAGLEASWAILGRLGRFWRRLGGLLEASWALLGSKRWPTWLQVACQNGAKIDQESIQKLNQLLDASWNRHPSFSIDFWNQKLCHVGSKMHSKIDLILKRHESQNHL